MTVSSRAHERGTIDFDNLNGERDYNRMTHYGHSKVANVMFSAELGRKLKGKHFSVCHRAFGKLFIIKLL